MNIPLVNLKRMHEPIKKEINEAIKNIVDNNDFINGNMIFDFEKNFKEFLSVKNVIGVSSGTDAIFLALKAISLKPNEIVITVPNTFIATTEAITLAGGKIQFVDVDKKTSNMDPVELEKFLNNCKHDFKKRIKAIVFVNLYGNPDGLHAVSIIAKKHNITLISDAAQAHGALINEKSITDYADLTTYSFFPAKNLGAFGDAGAVATNNNKLADKIIMLRNHGRIKKYYHDIEGFNCRIDTLQAAILNVKLKKLKDWNNNRIKSAELYDKYLKDKAVEILEISDNVKSVYHLYVIKIENRDEFIEKLKNAGIEYGIHYPVPLHLQPAYKYLGYKKGDFQITEDLSKKILSLPIDGTISPEEIKYISGKV